MTEPLISKRNKDACRIQSHERLTCRQYSNDVILDVIIGEHALILQNVIDEYAVAVLIFLLVVVVRDVVVVVGLQYLPAFFDNPLMEVFQVDTLRSVLTVSLCKLKNRVRIDQRLVL